jgi:hypothetical protein
MSSHTYLLFLPVCFALNMGFGPNNLLSLSNGARNGVLHSVTASFGRLVAFACVFHGKSSADSTLGRALIPRQIEHVFHARPSADSTTSRA